MDKFSIIKPLVLIVIIWSFETLSCHWPEQVLHNMTPMIMTGLIGWPLTHYYYDEYIIYYRIDILTTYFIIWQIMYLVWQWKSFELEWPFFILQQVSVCINTSLKACFLNEFIFRYFSFKTKIIFLWILSF